MSNFSNDVVRRSVKPRSAASIFTVIHIGYHESSFTDYSVLTIRRTDTHTHAPLT